MNTENIKELIKVFEDSTLAKMELEVDDMKIKMEKPGMAEANYVMPQMVQPMAQIAATQPASLPVQEPAKEEKKGYWVKAPIVGTFYQSRAVGSAPFIEIGKRVKKGDILCIIEAMKVMNEIQSPVDGVIAEMLVTNESMVEFDQEMIRISEDA